MERGTERRERERERKRKREREKTETETETNTKTETELKFIVLMISSFACANFETAMAHPEFIQRDLQI